VDAVYYICCVPVGGCLVCGNIAFGYFYAQGGGRYKTEYYPSNRGDARCCCSLNGYQRKVAATSERTIADSRYAGGYGDARQSVAIRERKIADSRYAGRYGDARQSGATIERTITDSRYAGGYGETTADTTGRLYKLCQCFVIHYAVDRCVVGISSIYIDARQAGATSERLIADSRYAGGYGDARQAGATIERKIADSRYAGGYGDARQSGATKERTIADSRYAGGYGETAADTAGCLYKLRQRFIVQYAVDRRVVGISRSYIDARQAGATRERTIADSRYAGEYGDACQAGATKERTNADTRYVGGYGDARQAGATIERITADSRYAVGEKNAGHRCITEKPKICYPRYRLSIVFRRNDYDCISCRASTYLECGGKVYRRKR